MSAFPSMPLWTDAYLADTRHLSAQEHGAYLLLLMSAWRTAGCTLPDDDETLSRWASVDARTWRRIKPRIMAFWTLSDGSWTQRRLSKEREFVSKRAEVSRQNGGQGGRPKSLKNNKPENPAGSPQDTRQEPTYTYTYQEKEDAAPPPVGGVARPAGSSSPSPGSPLTGAPPSPTGRAVDELAKRVDAEAVLADVEASDEDRFYALRYRLADKGVVWSRAMQLAKLHQEAGEGFAATAAALDKALRARNPSTYLGKVVSELQRREGRASRAPSRRPTASKDPPWVADWRDDGVEVRPDGPNRWLAQGCVYDDEMNEIGF